MNKFRITNNYILLFQYDFIGTDKLYDIMFYRVGFGISTSLVIGTDCIGIPVSYDHDHNGPSFYSKHIIITSKNIFTAYRTFDTCVKLQYKY